MDAQQLAPKVAALESRVAALEDEGKIVKGEVKQILTEIRSAILVRDNPFDESAARRQQAMPQAAAVAPAPPIDEPMPEPAPLPARAEPQPITRAAAVDQYDDAPKEPVMLRPTHQLPPEPEKPAWTLLTIASLTAWAEEAMRRLGALRLEILLDLCEASGHLTHEARVALARVTELDLPEPERTPSTNETVVMLRQLDALLNDEAADMGASPRHLRAA